MSHYTYIWEFYVAAEMCSRFEAEYGPQGSWVGLFRTAPGYVKTSLLHDTSDPSRYLTIDVWESIEAHAAFRAGFAPQYEAIDRRCEGLTLSERAIGEFTE